ncbi:hypothetical protein QPK87_05795 [Kamptonema cortianum]|nr:hypothetical protein [Kamptonema cortianum]
MAEEVASHQALAQAQVDAAYVTLVLSVFAGVGIVFGILNLILPFMPKTEKWWVAHLINIVLGVGSGCLTIPFLFILIAWLKPGLRNYFSDPPPNASAD